MPTANAPQLDDLPLVAWIGLALLMLTQSVWLFLDARKRDRFPWLWGLWGLIQFPLPTLVYVWIVIKPFRKK